VAAAGVLAASGSAEAKLQDAGAAQVQKAPTLAQARGARGTVTMCGGASDPALVRGFNRRYKAQRLKLRVVDFPEEVDRYEELSRRLRQRSRGCDFFSMDLDFIGEFAASQWLLDVTPIVRPRKAEFIASTLTTARYRGRYVGVPLTGDTGLLYYRTDRIATVPDTWQGVYDSARVNGGMVYQGGPYEGLTCDFLEIAWAAGGEVLAPNGRTSAINSPENLRALQFMVDGIRSGAAPSLVTFMDEFVSHMSFFTGGPAFMRDWPYAYKDVGPDSSIVGKFDVVPLPAFAGGGRAGVLGGLDLVISAYAKNPRGAVLAVDYLTSSSAQALAATHVNAAPVLSAVYDDPAVKEALPYAGVLKQAIEFARARPVTPDYHDISAAIYTNVNAALNGAASPAAALRAADRQINAVLRPG
jgi:multiple sugar transport system substrate-binding protein